MKTKIPVEQIAYINFEDDRLLSLTVNDLGQYIDAYYELYPDNRDRMSFLFFDEIQNVSDWEVFIRRIYDNENVRIFITGSSSKLLSREIATSLRGRTLSYKIFPLDFREFLKFKGLEISADFAYTRLRYKIKNLLDEYINFGGFPEIVLAASEFKLPILKDYYEMIIYRDLVERFSIRNIRLLRDLMKSLITNIANLFSINAYYKSIGPQFRISRETVMEYLAYLEEIDLIHLVPIFSYSLKSQQVNPKKIYVIDNGLRNAVAFRFSQDEGRLVENIVCQELIKRSEEIYYWKGKYEVDFVFKKAKKLNVINVSYGKTLDTREINGLLEFKKHFRKVLKDMIIITKDIEKIQNGIKYIPLWKWLIAG
ncbi:MAG: ATP-binding protein [bacterium]